MSSDAAHTLEDPKRRLLEARRALYREAILDAAERVFAEHGYDAAKVQAIAKAAGVSLQTFYTTFPKKWDVLRAVQLDRLGKLMHEVGTAVLSAGDVFDRLRAGLEGYLRFHMEHPDFLRMQLRDRVPWGTTDELRTPEQTRAWETGLQMLMAAFREGMAAGLLVESDPELCARTSTAMSQVRLVLWLDRDMHEGPEAVAREAMLLFVRAFARPERVAELSARVEASSTGVTAARA